jgi:hypothetical protein
MEPSEPSHPKHRPSYFTPKIKFTPAEDESLRQAVDSLGPGDWPKIAELVGSRNARQCRERWKNYLDPQISTSSPWTMSDEALLRQKYAELGGKWNYLASLFPGRSTNNVKNKCICLHRNKKQNRGGDLPIDDPNESSQPNFNPSSEIQIPAFSLDPVALFAGEKDADAVTFIPELDSTSDWFWF